MRLRREGTPTGLKPCTRSRRDTATSPKGGDVEGPGADPVASAEELPLQLVHRSHAQDEPNALFDLAQGRGGESADPLVEEAPIERRDLRHVDDRACGQAARSADDVTRGRREPQVGGEETTTTVCSRLRLKLSACSTSTGRRRAGSDPRGSPRSAHHRSPRSTLTRTAAASPWPRRSGRHRAPSPDHTPCRGVA